MATGVYRITDEFEKSISDYTGAYGITESGVFSAVKEEEKERINILSRKIIMDKV